MRLSRSRGGGSGEGGADGAGYLHKAHFEGHFKAHFKGHFSGRVKLMISFARNNSGCAREEREGWKFGLAAALDL